MSISQALSNANSGLAAASRRAGVTSNNIANALTEGFSRRDVSLAERVTGGVGAGVSVVGVTRAANPAITFERRGADAEFARNDARASVFTQISNLLGGPDDPNALFQRYANLEARLRSLANSPESAAAQQGGVTAAKDLANAFNRLSGAYTQIRIDADSEIATRVGDINGALKQIENLNGAISRGSSAGADVNALIDQRQRLVDTINESIPVRELQRDNGKIDLMTKEGVFLLAGTARTVAFTASPSMTPQSGYNNGAGPLSGLSVDGVDITPGGPSAQAPREGAFAGLFSVRDDIVPEMSLALDALAQDLVDRFAGPGLDPTLAPGAPGLFTDAGAAFNPANLTGLAGRIQINAAVDPAAGGEPFRLRDGLGVTIPGPAGTDAFVRALISAMNDNRPANAALQAGGALNAAEGAAHLTSLAGGARADASAARNASEILAQSLSDAETLETGVDTDRELQNLLTIEQAYAANARVIQTVDRMIQRLLDI